MQVLQQQVLQLQAELHLAQAVQQQALRDKARAEAERDKAHHTATLPPTSFPAKSSGAAVKEAAERMQKLQVWT